MDNTRFRCRVLVMTALAFLLAPTVSLANARDAPTSVLPDTGSDETIRNNNTLLLRPTLDIAYFGAVEVNSIGISIETPNILSRSTPNADILGEQAIIPTSKTGHDPPQFVDSGPTSKYLDETSFDSLRHRRRR